MYELDNHSCDVINHTLFLHEPPLVCLIHQLQHHSVGSSFIQWQFQPCNKTSIRVSTAITLTQQTYMPVLANNGWAISSGGQLKSAAHNSCCVQTQHVLAFDDTIGSMQHDMHEGSNVHLSAPLLHSFTVANNVNSVLALNEFPNSIACQDHELVHWRQLPHCALRLRCHTHPARIIPSLYISWQTQERSRSTWEQAPNPAKQHAK